MRILYLFRLINFKDPSNVFSKEETKNDISEMNEPPSISGIEDISEIEQNPPVELEKNKIEILDVIRIEKKKNLITLKLQVENIFIYVAQIFYEDQKLLSLTRVQDNADSLSIGLQRIFYKEKNQIRTCLSKRMHGLLGNSSLDELLNKKMFEEEVESRLLVDMKKSDSIVISGSNDDSYFYLDGADIVFGSMLDKVKEKRLIGHKSPIKYLFRKEKLLFS